jgi:hypothetical protein
MYLHLLLALDVLPTFTLQLSKVFLVFFMSRWYALKTVWVFTDLLLFFLWLMVLWLWRRVNHVELLLKFGNCWVETLFKPSFFLNHWLRYLLILAAVFENLDVIDLIFEAFAFVGTSYIVCLHVHKNFNGIFNFINDFEAVYVFELLLLL